MVYSHLESEKLVSLVFLNCSGLSSERALPGCLIVLCSLGTDWMMGWGSFSSAVGSGGLPRALVRMGLGPPPWADLG